MQELIKDLNKNERILFPVSFELKVIMDGTIPDAVNKDNIETVLKELEIPYQWKRNRLSARGRYMSFTYHVTLDEYLKMEGLYNKLKVLPGIKFAV